MTARERLQAIVRRNAHIAERRRCIAEGRVL